ncbi:autotransporter-associated beta strand repeat-containing protein [Zoogloea ramigera]|uniref:autotransporter-associated beta strand repeat-containing protein n=1 Tax=Zoogloea ramigera TaxID=350 RepID=UPI003FA2E742
MTQTSDDTCAGQITGSGPASGTAALSKTGAGVLTLSGANSFTGLTQVSEGALRVTASNALAAASSLEVTGTGTFEIDGVALNSLASLTLTGGLAGLETLAGRGTASYGGTVTMVGHARMETAGASDTLTLGGQIDGRTDVPTSAAPILQKVGGGVLVLDGTGSLFYPQILAGTLRATSDGVLPNTETLVGPGATLDIANTTQSIAHLSGGDAASRVLLGASGQLTVNQGLENAYAGSISGGAASVFAKAGNATLHLSGASPDYFGVTRVQAGTLSVSGSGNVLGSGGVEVSDGATLDIDAVNLGVTSLQLTGSGVGGSGALTGAGAARYDGTVSLNDPGPVVLGVADGGYLTLGGPLSGGVAMSVVKQGLGTLGLRDSAGFGGGTTIAAGTLVAQHASALGGGGVLVNDGASLLIDSVTLTTGGLTLNGRGVQEGGALQGAGTAAHAGAVTLNTASAIGAAAGSTLTLNNPLTGPGGLAKVGSGRLDLTAGSSYAGGTTIEAGTLVAQHASALGGGGVLVNDGASLLIDSVTLTTGGLTLNGRGVGGAGALQGTGTAGHSGPVTIATASAIGAPTLADMLTFDSPVTGPGSLSKVGLGVVELWGNNSYAGGTTIESGTLRLLSGASLSGGGAVSLTGTGIFDLNDTRQSIGNLAGAIGTQIALGSGGAGGLTVNQTSDGSFAGVISGSGSGTGALNKLGSGTLTLSGANTFTGLTRVSEGVLRVSNPNALAAASSLLLTNTGTFEIDGVAFNSLASLTLTGDQAGLETLAGRGAASYAGTVTLLGLGRVAAAGASDALTLSGHIDGHSDAGANPALTKAGAGTVTLSGINNGYAGGTTIAAGTLVVQQADALGSGTVTVNDGATLEIDNVMLATAGLTLNGSGVGGAGALQGVGAAGHAGPITLATTSAVAAPTLADTLTFDSPVTGPGSLNKLGLGVVNLWGSNRYAGGTTIAAGTLRLLSGASLPGGGAVSLMGTGILDLNDTSQTIGNLSGEAGTRIALGSGNLTVSQGSAGSFAGRVDGSGNLTKQGTARLSLSGANTTYSGTTRVLAGTLTATGSGSALGSGAVQVSGGATLEIDIVPLSPGGLTLNGRGVSGAGALRGSGPASHTGTVTLATASAIGAATLTDTLSLNNPVTGLGLTKVGSGTVNLSGSNRYVGGTTIEAGTLRLLGGATLPSLGAVNLTGSGILDLNNTNQSIGDLAGTVGTRIDLGSGDLTVTQAAAGSFAGRVAGSGDLTKQGTAQLSLSGASSGYSGTTRVEAGTLVATGSGSALGTGAVQVSDGATLALDDITLGVSSISLQGHGVGGLGVLTGTGAAAYAGSLALDGPASIGVAAAGDTLSLGGAVSGGALARLTKLGAGTLSLSAASPYAGGTTISAGHLVAAGSGALGSGAVRVAGGALDVGAATLGNSIVLAGGALNAVGSALLTGAVSQLADSRISAAQAPASLTLQQAFAGGGHTLSVAGPGRVSLAGGAAGLASIVQDMGSELRLGDGKSIISSGAQIYSGVVKGLNATLASTALNAIAATGSGNDFTGTLHVTAGDTTLSDSNALSVVLDTGATKLTAGQALAVSGTAASLVTDSEALVFGDTLVTGNGSFTARGAVSQLAGQALQVGGTTTVDAIGQTVSLTEAGNKFDGLVTLKAGKTNLYASENLNVLLNQTGDTTLGTDKALTLGGTAANLVTDSAVLTFGATRVTGNGSFTVRGAVSQLAGQALQVDGATTVDATGQTVSLTEAANTFGGLVTVKAGQTDLRARDSLNVSLDQTGATTLTAGDMLTLGGTAASLATDSAALTFGTTQVTGGGSFTARGAVSQLAGQALQVGGATTFDAGSEALSLTEAGNTFGGLVTVKAGQTDLRARDSLNVSLDQTGATTLTAGDALTLAGTAASLVTDSAALTFGVTRVTGDGRFTARGAVSQLAGQALNVGGTTTFDAGSEALSLTEAGNTFGGLVTVKAGQTDLRARDSLNVSLDQTGATTLTAGDALTLAGTAASLVTDSAALTFGATRVTGDGSFTVRGAVSQLTGKALQIGGATTVDAAGQTVSLTEAVNTFGGLVTVKAGQTDLSASDNLNVALDQIGATTLTAGQALTLAGSAASLVTDSAALTFGVTRVTGDGSFTARGAVSQLAGQALQVGGATTFDAGSQTLTLTEASNTFGGLVTVKAGDTALRSRDSLNVALSTGATTLIAGQALTLGGTAASLVTDSAALTFGTTRVVGDGSFTARGPVSQLANGTLVVDGRTQLDITLRSVTNSIVLANRGNVFGGVLAGEIDLGPGAADSSIRSEQAITLGALDVRGKGVLEIESHADMAKILVPDVATVLASSNGKPCDTSQSCVSVQLNEGTPQRLSVYEASISQLAGTRISTEPEATLSLRASGKGSIDLSAEALVEVTPAGGVESSVTGPAGLLSVYSRAGSEQRVLTHAGGTTNTIQGPLAAVTQANTSQDSPDKTVVVVASDTIRVAAKDGIDGDTVMLMAREIAGGGGKIQTHVAATGMRDGRNIRTGVDPNPDQNYSILPSIFVIADAPGDTSATYSFGSLGNPISMSFGYVGTPVANSLLQTIAVEPYRRGDPAGAVPVYLDTRVQVGVDPKGPIRRFLVFPAGTPTGSIRMVVVDGVEILDSSAFASVQSAVAELLNQVRKEQLESASTNENVAAQRRRGVITETRAGPAAVDRFQGVAPAGGCVGTMIGEMLVCAPAAGPQQP